MAQTLERASAWGAQLRQPSLKRGQASIRCAHCVDVFNVCAFSEQCCQTV